ncbi:MAG: hypothetical protein GY927_06655 [bacterium]|nr:hypothetical protein [bacterium]
MNRDIKNEVIETVHLLDGTVLHNWSCGEVLARYGVKILKKAQWNEIRRKRSAMLSECDWTQLPDTSLNEGCRSSWASYRQSLRDITGTFAKPEDVLWPKHP